jgi:IS30 family transposase
MKQSGLGQIKDAISISERPASVEDRAVPGHWEGDLIGGSRNSYVATLVERHSRYAMLIKVANKDTEGVVSALIKHSQKLPGELYRSLTWDRGKELADHQRLTLATDVEVYFCDPRSPWQRGSRGSSTNAQERPRSTKPRRRSSLSVLQRSVEPTAKSGHCTETASRPERSCSSRVNGDGACGLSHSWPLAMRMAAADAGSAACIASRSSGATS